MTLINTTSINVNDIIVAAYNADPFAVEGAEVIEAVAQTLEEYGEAAMYTAADGEEFVTLAEILDYTEDNLPSKVYTVGGNHMTFATL